MKALFFTTLMVGWARLKRKTLAWFAKIKHPKFWRIQMTKDELIDKIQKANSAYSAGIPYMTDSEYDLLWQELYQIDPDNKLLYHTARNDSILTGAITHRYPIYGTAKAFNTDDLMPYLTRFGSRELVIEPKYDGCAAVLELTSSGWQLALEGDGIRGADITFLLPHIKCPFKARHFQSIEIVIPYKDWDPTYGKNPRSVVIGWTNPTRKEAPPAKMTAVPHNFGPFSHHYNYDGDLDKLNELLLKLHTEWKEIYPIDGLMIKVADEKARLLIGTDGPRNAWSIAWKPPIQTATTIVTNIEWNVSRLGRVIPTVIYEPIELCGTTNQRVTGNNAQWIVDRQIRVGSTLLVGKAGEIIPKILKVTNESGQAGQGQDEKTSQGAQNTTKNSVAPDPGRVVPTKQTGLKTPIFSVPGLCPICNSKLTWDSVHLICDSETCIAKQIVSLAYFYSHKGINVDGVGEATIEKILMQPKGYEILKDRPWALLDMLTYDLVGVVHDAVGEKIFTKIYSQTTAISGTKTMAHFIAGLGLTGLAYKTSLRLCQFLKTGKLNIHVSIPAKQNFIAAVATFNTAMNEMKNFSFAQLPQPAKAIYCITGTVSKSREAFVEELSLFGYEFSAGVTRETNYLIVGEEPGKTKIAKATRYNIPMVTEEQFNIITTED
jgi:DNA ligase (NAD+)